MLIVIFLKNKMSFWVRDVMAGMQLIVIKQGDSGHSFV